MAITYYDTLVNWFPAQGPPVQGESYAAGGYEITLGVLFYYNDTTYIFANISGNLDPGWYTLSANWNRDPAGRDIKSDSDTRFRAQYHFYVTDSGGSPLEGVSGLGTDSGSGHYRSSLIVKPVTTTFTPTKSGYEFDPITFTDESRSAYITVIDTTVPTRQIDTPTPSDTSTGIVLVPLLQWKIDGASETEEGDLFDIYLKAGDSDFGEDDLLQSGRVSLSIQILSGLSYNTLYYWKVLASSTAGDLLDSAVWTFTTILFLPPVVSGGATPTGVNNMVTIKRLVVASNNKIWWES